MILRSSPASPFGRKVKIAALVLGLMDQIEVVVANTLDPDDVIRKQNPLGKIPALILKDGILIMWQVAEKLYHCRQKNVLMP